MMAVSRSLVAIALVRCSQYALAITGGACGSPVFTTGTCVHYLLIEIQSVEGSSREPVRISDRRGARWSRGVTCDVSEVSAESDRT